ncbi:uncharacterized protein LOC123308275 [Coccinella septempunctata]|uniref:uncharacterized protein LOC123308275 n=1 Tax=Coccinella septempunctata TaxID=41139 RepID=UPI001D077DEA|nr:uncharacterized protein LOC123308275 [Coccinella septempunctata]
MMTSKYLLFCCLAILVFCTKAVPLTEPRAEDAKNQAEHVAVQEVENKVQQPAAIDRIDADLPLSDKPDEKNDKEDLETANTFWGGYYRTPVWGWGRGWGYGGYPSYRSYGWGGRGYNGWGSGYRGWSNGYYWR